MEQKQRKSQLNLVVGINGTGKTTFLRTEVLPRFGKALVLTPDDMEWRQLPTLDHSRLAQEVYSLTGQARVIYKGPDTLETVIKYYSGGVLVLDDAMAYLGFQTSETMRYLYIRRRQRGVDIYLVAHGLRQVPVQAFTFGSYLILFASTENFSARKRDLQPDTYERIEKAQQELAEECRESPWAHRVITLDPQLR